MDLDQLVSFIRMAELGSLSQAAEELYLGSSSLASRMKALEQEVGQELFILRGRNLKLSKTGEVFLPYARRVCYMAEEMEQEISLLDRNQSGTLNLAVTPVIATYILPQLMKRFEEQYPNVNIKVQACPSHMINNYLLRGMVDLGIIQNRERHETLQYSYWFCDKDVLVVSNNHPWAEKKEIDVGSLTTQPLLAFKRKTYLWKDRISWIKKQGVNPWIGMELAHVETIKEILLHDYGYAFLPLQGVKTELKEGSLKEINLKGASNWERKTFFVMSRKRGNTEQNKAFINFAIKNVEFT